MRNLLSLPASPADGVLNVVVETPAGDPADEDDEVPAKRRERRDPRTAVRTAPSFTRRR